MYCPLWHHAHYGNQRWPRVSLPSAYDRAQQVFTVTGVSVNEYPHHKMNKLVDWPFPLSCTTAGTAPGGMSTTLSSVIGWVENPTRNNMLLFTGTFYHSFSLYTTGKRISQIYYTAPIFQEEAGICKGCIPVPWFTVWRWRCVCPRTVHRMVFLTKDW